MGPNKGHKKKLSTGHRQRVWFVWFEIEDSLFVWIPHVYLCGSKQFHPVFGFFDAAHLVDVCHHIMTRVEQQ